MLSTTVWNSTLLIVARMLGVAFTIMGARIMSQADFGFLLSFIAVVSLGSAVLSIGIPNTLTHLFSAIEPTKKHSHDDERLTVALVLLVVLSVFVIIVVGGIYTAGLVGAKIVWNDISLYALAIAIYSLMVARLCSGALRGVNRTVCATVVDAVGIKAAQVLSLVVLLFWQGVHAVVSSIILFYVLRGLLAVILFTRGFKGSKIFNKVSMPLRTADNLKYAGNTWAVTILQTLRNRGDVICVALLLSYDRVSVFTVGVTTASLILFVLRGLSPSIRPALTAMTAKGDLAGVQEIYIAATRNLIVVSIPVVLFVFFSSDVLINSLFGGGYSESNLIVKIVMACLLPMIITGPANTLLLARRQTSDIRNIELVSMMLFFLFCVPGAYFFDVYGVAGAYGLSFLVQSVMKFRRISDCISISRTFNAKILFFVIFNLLVVVLVNSALLSEVRGIYFLFFQGSVVAVAGATIAGLLGLFDYARVSYTLKSKLKAFA